MYFRDLIRVPKISNRVPRVRENYHQVLKIRENRVSRNREIGSLQQQVHTGYLTISLKKPSNMFTLSAGRGPCINTFLLASNIIPLNCLLS